MNFYDSHSIALEKLSNERSYKFSWILTLTESYKHYNLAHVHNLHHYYNAYSFMLEPFKNCPTKFLRTFSWTVLTLSEVRTIRILRVSLIFAVMNFYGSHVIALQKPSNERSYQFRWILALTEAISIIILSMLIIYTIMNFYWSMLLPFKNCPISSYKFSWILTLTEVRTIRILRMRLISAITNFYGSHAIALQKLSIFERSYKFSWILTLTESYKHYESCSCA